MRSDRATHAALGALLFAISLAAKGAEGIGPDHPEELQQAIIEAYRAGMHKIVIPRGTYRIEPKGEGPHLQFRDLSDFEIDARGVELVFTDQTRGGIEFRDCRKVRLRGAIIRFEVPPFTQGSVEEIAPDGMWYEVRLEKGYPANFDDPKYFPAHPIGYLFDAATRWWKPGTFDLNGEKIERLGPDRFRVYWSRPMGREVHPVAVGDLIAFRGLGDHNLRVLNSADMEITDVTIYNAGLFAVWEFDGEGHNRYAVSVKRGPRPAGASTDPLLSSTADAFHSTNVRQGPILEHCDFEGMADDGIAIHGTFSFVFGAREDKLIINNNSFRPGDPLRLFDQKGQPAGEALVKAIQPLTGFENDRKSQRVTRLDNTQGPYFEVTLDHALPAEFDDLVSNPAAEGSGYILRQNTIRNHRARGMLLKADNGLVEGNTIDGSTMGGIVLSPEFWWNEASYSHDVIIRNNTIRHVAYAPDQLGSVLIATTENAPVAGCGHRRILIEGNRFVELNGVNLLITSACDVTVRKNRFIQPQHQAAESAGRSWGEHPDALVFVTEARQVRFEGNTASGLGPFNKQLIEAAPSAIQLDGVKTGIKSTPSRKP
jgi:hypothetical protein